MDALLCAAAWSLIWAAVNLVLCLAPKESE